MNKVSIFVKCRLDEFVRGHLIVYNQTPGISIVASISELQKIKIFPTQIQTFIQEQKMEVLVNENSQTIIFLINDCNFVSNSKFSKSTSLKILTGMLITTGLLYGSILSSKKEDNIEPDQDAIVELNNTKKELEEKDDTETNPKKIIKESINIVKLSDTETNPKKNY